MINSVLLILFSYLIGSISSAILVCRIMRLPDPKSIGSKNPGTTNVLRIGGKTAAVITLTGDILKGLIPICISRLMTNNSIVIALVGLSTVLGHLYPLFFKFEGGKGIATSAGVFIGINSQLIVILLVIWITSTVIFRYSSLSSLISTGLAPFLMLWILPDISFFIMSIAISSLLFVRHRDNIVRLCSGQEKQI